MKNKLIAILCCFVLIFALAGCGNTSYYYCRCDDIGNQSSNNTSAQLSDFIGSFSSVWAEDWREYRNTAFSLEIRYDRSFTITFTTDSWEDIEDGFWVTTTTPTAFGLICFSDDDFYFTLTKVGDGRLVLVFGRLGLGISGASAVLFERN